MANGDDESKKSVDDKQPPENKIEVNIDTAGIVDELKCIKQDISAIKAATKKTEDKPDDGIFY